MSDPQGVFDDLGGGGFVGVTVDGDFRLKSDELGAEKSRGGAGKGPITALLAKWKFVAIGRKSCCIQRRRKKSRRITVTTGQLDDWM